jgi:hypothetical protein
MLRRSAEPVLFFLLGIFAFLLVEASMSFHASNCNDPKQTESPNSKQPNAQTASDNSGDHGQDAKQQYNKTHKIVCGITGLYGVVGVLDSHEGFFVGIFTFCLFIATLFLWGSTNKLWQASEDQLAATQRPWVKVDSIGHVSPLVFEHGEGRIDLRVVVSNKGNSPGLRVRVDVKLVASNQINLLQEQQVFAAARRRTAAPNELRPELTSWPAGDTITFGVTAWLNSIDMPRFKPLADNTPFPVTLLAIVGCVTYEFSFAAGFHQTGIIYDLHRIASGNAPASPVVGAVPLDGTIPQHELNISLNFAGTGPVD